MASARPEHQRGTFRAHLQRHTFRAHLGLDLLPQARTLGPQARADGELSQHLGPRERVEVRTPKVHIEAPRVRLVQDARKRDERAVRGDGWACALHHAHTSASQLPLAVLVNTSASSE